ncbi:MAG: P-loop NTPase, partial [Brevundimonas sp.]|nr:P-loop NTPase [Brevundimonas sp.]
PLDGAIIVTTPQEVALADARRAHALFHKVGTPVLGLVQTMSGDIFGADGGPAEAARLGIPVLGDIPLDAAVRQAGDAGRPVTLDSPDGEAGRRFTDLARAVADTLNLTAS